MTMTRVAGHCPMGCGQTLFLGEGGHVTCASLPCPNPCLVDDLLADPETEHVIKFSDETFAILHPLRERAEELFACPLHEHVIGLSGPPVEPGRYRAYVTGTGVWHWDKIVGDPT